MRTLMATAALGVAGFAAAIALAAPLPASDIVELRRGRASVDASASEEAALRQARKTGEPSAAFKVGTALGAWINAAAQLDYDLKTPSGDGDDSGAIAIDCFDERTAFDHLEARRKAMGWAIAEAAAASGPSDRGLATAWTARQGGPAARCR